MKLLIHVILFIVLISKLYAHPVIWKGGIVTSLSLTNDMDQFKIHHSFDRFYSTGFHFLRFKDEKKYKNETSFTIIKLNTRPKRWNTLNSQGNVYLSYGLGYKDVFKPSNFFIAYFNLQMDWETRKVYTMFNYDAFLKTRSLHKLTTRLGWSPYLVGYNGISTWLIIQMDSTMVKHYNSKTTFLPVVRFFKQNILVEFGSDFNERYLLSAMLHF